MGRKRLKSLKRNSKKGSNSSTYREKENVPLKKTVSKYSVDQLLDKAQECIDTFDYEVAQRFCERALEIEADNVRALETTGTLLLELDEQEKAKQCFGRAVELSPDSGHAKYMYLGQLFEGSTAVECFLKGIELMVKEKEKQQAQELAAACAYSASEPITDRDISSAYCSIAEIYMTDSCFDASAEELCQVNAQRAIDSDLENPEAYQLMASYQLSKENKDEAKDNINKSVSLWLPKVKLLESNPENNECDPIDVVPLSYETRIVTAKILTEVSEYESAVDILEGLLDENDEHAQVWYMMGWANYLHGEDYRGNARYYLKKSQEVYNKTKYEDKEMLKHIHELLEELGPDEDDNDDDTLEIDSEADTDEEMEL